MDAKNRAISQTGSKNREVTPLDTVDIVTQRISLASANNSTSPPLDNETRKRYEVHDLFRVKSPAFLANYKNPCWKQLSSSRLVCLPYFYLAGFPKCGTTFTFQTIVGHPEAVKGVDKEPHWITKTRFKSQTFHPIITGDGSASTAWENPYWRYLPGNYNCTEPRVLIPHYVYHLNPSSKVIFVVRNPTDRVISSFNYFAIENMTAESFHTEIIVEIRTFKDCCSRYSLRVCAYDLGIRVRSGLYHVFIRDWMKVFPADQILVVRLEDIRDDLFRAFTRIFDFLSLSQLSRLELQEILNKSKLNDRTKRFRVKQETRRLLDDFYRPHNTQLARLLQQHDPSSYLHLHDAMYSH
ncbi:carbohydrate sulfotransferase 15-like [Haliotis asinina]|uniref:carbohydrate sulfotransferase 15-like n=1 Tax=Haliotis asinina TaxID=109174 RepID=UPI003532700F